MSKSLAAVPLWQTELAHAVSDPAELLALLDLDRAWLPAARAAARLFPLRVPRGYVARMRRGDIGDPLLRQVLPIAAEHAHPPGFSLDAVGDLDSLRDGVVLHKYHGRALLISTGACAINCRFCFRRHFPYADVNASRGGFRVALASIERDPSLEEIILSGGDPLSLSDQRLSALAHALDTIPHLKRLRIHTRQPVVLPERVDENLIAWMGGGRLRRVMVIHANHPNEIDAAVASALARLRQAGVVLLNQSVLLAGVNDSEDVLAALSERLFEADVLPYYLHLLDRVQGTAHFEVTEARASELMAALRARLPGYLVPRLVREEAGEPAKTPKG